MTTDLRQSVAPHGHGNKWGRRGAVRVGYEAPERPAGACRRRRRLRLSDVIMIMMCFQRQLPHIIPECPVA